MTIWRQVFIVMEFLRALDRLPHRIRPNFGRLAGVIREDTTVKLINPTYRLSGMEFFLYTLFYWVIMALLGIIFIAAGGSGSWLVPLLGLVSLLLYLQYMVRPRLKDMSHSSWWALAILVPMVILPWWVLLTPGFVILAWILWMMLTLLFFPGSQSACQGNTKNVPKKVTVPILIAVVLLGLFMLPLFYPGWEEAEGPKEAEWATFQTAIDTFMTDNALTEVTPSTSGVGGEKIDLIGTQFHATSSLDLYMRDTPTFCYRWDSTGKIISQDKPNGAGSCSGEAD